MGDLSPISTIWIPEDDLALKKAVEAGASLEAIAKGAVRFSRKFSVGEVQDRWYSLLYDPVVSKEAAYGMTEFEKSTTPLPSRLNRTKDNKLVPVKRKPESVRSYYHALRKRIRNEPFNSLDMNFLLTPSSSNHIGNGDEPNFPLLCDEFQLKNSDMVAEFSFQPESMHSEISHVLPSEFEIFELPDPECGEPFPNLDYSSPSPEWRTVEDVSSSAIPMTTQDKFVLPDLTRASVKMTSCGVNADNYLEELSHSLLNFTNEEELFFMDADGKDMIDKSYYDGLNSLLQNEITQEDHILHNETKPEGHTSPTASKIELSGGHKTSNSEDKTVSSPEFTVCLLNTEDIDIPNNDDVVLRYRSSSSSVLGRRFAKSNAPLFRDLSWYPKPIPKDKTRSQRIGIASQENGKLHQTADGGLPNGRVSSSRDSKVAPLPVPPKLKEEKIETTSVKQFSHKSADSKEKVDSRPQTNTSGTKQEADVQMEFHDHQQSNPELPLDEQHIESDDEIPHFSDVEAMILDMELDPEDQDIYEQEVSKYLHEDAMKGVIRLEQGAHSCIQRDISSHGAFAILYGRLSKHYIKKPEVLIGRTTEDMIVDIDLGRGGIGNRISRRQSLISMDKDGSFRLTNLGKYPVLINHKEVAHGEVLSIAPNSLIEIRGMPFIFDTNKTCVKKFLERKET